MNKEDLIEKNKKLKEKYDVLQTGFRISECDLSTGKVVVNGIEITSIEDWEKVINSLVDLQQENQQLNQLLKDKGFIIDKLMEENRQLKEELEKIKQPTIFIDTQDMEERYGEQLYQDYLVEQNKLQELKGSDEE